MSVHEVGLSDLMDMARLSDTAPRRRALIGIQPASLDLGAEPSPAVAAAVPVAARTALDLAQQWRLEATLHK
jgi:hydrogenase maturation protease